MENGSLRPHDSNADEKCHAFLCAFNMKSLTHIQFISQQKTDEPMGYNWQSIL